MWRSFLVIIWLSLLIACRSVEPTATPAPPTSSAQAANISPSERNQLADDAASLSVAPNSAVLIDAAGLDFAEQRVIDVYKSVSPSVVNITTRVLTRTFFFDVVPQEGAGSGFVLDTDGHILTNYHVIEGAQPDSLEVTFGDDTMMSARIVGIDPRNDIAVLKLTERAPPSLLVPIELGNSANLQVGQRAIAIGNPFGEFSRTLTTGVISALNRTLEGPEGRTISGIIQTDASINRGNSGGPLLDSAGRVIGVNTAIFSPTGTSAGVGFAVPVDTVKRVLPDLLSLGRYRHPWLGIGPGSAYRIYPEFARALNLASDQGLLLVRVGGPLARAGVRGARRQALLGNRRIYTGGDILSEIEGRAVTSYDDLQTFLETGYKVGDEVTVKVMQGGRERELTLRLEEEP